VYRLNLTMETGERRIHTLARPKRIPIGFIDDSRSVYWNNNISKDWSKPSDVHTKFTLTQRLKELTCPKPMHKEWTGDRPSPIWLVRKTALNTKPTQRLECLAVPKRYHPEYHPKKSVYTTVSRSARNAIASSRLEELAKSKEYAELPIKPDSCWDYSEWESDVSKAALQYTASSRIENLSNAKKLHGQYKECRPVMWTVSTGAKKTLPSQRVQKLARPKSRSQYKEDYDSNWYKVSKGAMTAKPTARVEDLAAPIPRKVRQKRMGVTKS